MRDMLLMNATDVRRDWSEVIDEVVRDKPKFIKRTRDCIMLTNISLFENLLNVYNFTADKFIEDDGSVTLSLNQIDLIENGKDEQEARQLLAKSILEYAEDYYKDFSLYSSSPNRKAHVPYVLKALICDDVYKIGDLVQCHAGKT
jgi:hypothetical protein